MITQEELKEKLSYEPETGIFTWITKPAPCIKKGSIAGCINSDGYIVIRIASINYYAHRLAWLFMVGYFSKEQIDHKDGVPYNNAFSNLREATRFENSRNRKLSARNTSGYTGVCWSKNENKWIAFAHKNKSRLHLGYFEHKEDAIKERKKYALNNYGEFLREDFL
jgi:hypothetical protein